MADRAMAWKERPVDFVSTFGALTVNALGIFTQFGFCDYHTKVIPTLRTGPGEIYSHHIKFSSGCGYAQYCAVT
jgi:hypothetical protein